MADLPRISQAEWDVMEVIWAQPPVTANKVVEALSGLRDWSPRTVKTMLNRLVRKGALSFQPLGKRYLYRPNVSRRRYVRSESRSFLRRVFAGKEASMLVHLVGSAKLSREEIRELRKILDTKKGN